MTNTPLVSVVVPTLNSERYLERCLKSVKMQTYSNIEIIVVDNYSTDTSMKIAEKYADIVLTKGPERSAQVNFGVKNSKGEYVYRVDSDFVLELTVVEEAVRKCENNGIDAICVHNTSDSTVSFWAKVRKLERDCYKYDDLTVAARFIRKKVFELMGGFNESIVAAEDYDLHNKLISNGFKIGFIQSKELHIGEPNSLGEIVVKHYYYGKSIRHFLASNSDRGRRQLNPIRLSLLRNLNLFAKNPVLAFGFLVYQTVRYVSAGFGFFIEEISR